MGSAYTDVQFVINRLARDWGVLWHSVLGDDVFSWIEKGKPMGTLRMICNGDIMLLVTKGAFGLRIDNVLNVELNNVEFEDLQSIAELGRSSRRRWTRRARPTRSGMRATRASTRSSSGWRRCTTPTRATARDPAPGPDEQRPGGARDSARPQI